MRIKGETIVLDRRQFLQVVAATGVAASGSATWYRLAAAQSASLAPSDVPTIVSATAASLGHDPERIFRFVRDEVRYEPYPGILRGANGTLVARAGNSADQALLLAELLAASSVPVRFALGELDDATAAALMATTVTDQATVSERTWQSLLSDEDVEQGIGWVLPADLPAADAAALLDLSGLRTALDQDREDLPVQAAEIAGRSIDLIQDALAGAGIEVAAGTSTMPLLERTQHAWVQVADGSAWRDLDPSIVAMPAGSTVAATATVDALPDALRHRVDLSVIGETLAGGALVQEPIMAASTFADRLGYVGIVFAHAPAADLGDIDLIGSGLGAGTEYHPIIVAGPTTIVGRRAISIGGAGGGALTDPFGGGGGEGLVEGETGAEWLEVSVTSPSGETAVARRTLFDRVGQAMRDSGSVDVYAFPPAEFVDLGDGAGEHYLPMRAAHALFVSGATPNLRTLIGELGVEGQTAIAAMPAGLDGTRAMVEAELAGSLGYAGFHDAPTIQALVIEPTLAGVSYALDILHRSFGSLALADVAPVVPPAMLSGVLAQAVEQLLTAGDRTADGAAPVVASVGAVFDAAAAQGIPTRTFVSSLPPDVSYPPEQRALIQRALDAGQVVIAPERPVDLGGRTRLGMWLVDPRTGAAVDQMDDGRGAAEPTVTYVVFPGTVLVAASTFSAAEISLFIRIGITLGALAGQIAQTANNPALRTRLIAAYQSLSNLGHIPSPFN